MSTHMMSPVTPTSPPDLTAGLVGATLQLRLGGAWFPVCDRSALIAGRGVAALLPDGRQVALFMDRAGRTYAIDNRDPYSGAQVLSRGLTGTQDGRAFVASPLLKQRFDLETGRCLDDDSVTVTVYATRVTS